MKTELLSPAGSLKNMRYAFAYGAERWSHMFEQLKAYL